MWFAAWVKMIGPQTRMARHCKRSIPLVSHIMLHYLYTYHIAEAWKLARRHARSFQFAQAIRFFFLIQLCTLKVKVASTPAGCMHHDGSKTWGNTFCAKDCEQGHFFPSKAGWARVLRENYIISASALHGLSEIQTHIIQSPWHLALDSNKFPVLRHLAYW